MKKIMSLIISAVILISSLSMAVYAASPVSGKCGDNLTYTYSDGTLTISGTGPMYNTEYNAESYINYGWVENPLEIDTLILHEGMTTIGAYAFSSLNISGEVTIPEGVTSIGLGAFSHSMGITSVSIPATVTNIGTAAFYDCPLIDIYYGGTPEQWNSITFGEENNNIYDAEVHVTSTSVTPSQNTAPSSSDEIKVILNGNTLQFDQPPVISKGRTLVPMRAILEALGASVEWDSETKSVTSAKDNTVVLLTVGSTTMTYSKAGESIVNVTLDAPPEIINGRTMIPARAIAEAFDCDVKWDSATRTVTITSNTISSTDNIETEPVTEAVTIAETETETVTSITEPRTEAEPLEITQTLIKGFGAVNAGESAGNILDGKPGTKWCSVVPTSAESNRPYIIWEVSEPVKVTGYTIVTANDNSKYPGRNPMNWTLYGCNSSSEPDINSNWTVIDERSNDRSLPDEDFADRYFTVTGNDSEYKYYMLMITASRGDVMMQMSEFELNYEGSGITPNLNNSAGTSSQQSPAESSSSASTSLAPQTCPICNGSGMIICPYCHGTGQGASMYMLGQEVPQGCTYCGSTGQRLCSGCGGSGKV